MILLSIPSRVLKTLKFRYGRLSFAQDDGSKKPEKVLALFCCCMPESHTHSPR